MRTGRSHTYPLLAIFSLFVGLGAIAHGEDLNLIEKPSGILPLGSKYGARIYFHTPQRTAPQTKWKEGDKMSGTRIEVTVSAFCGEPSFTTSGQVSDFKVFFENHSASSPINTPVAGWFGYDQRFKFRFATTITGDGNDLKFRVEATVRENHTQPSYNVSETFTFKAYNKLQLLGTRIDFFNQENSVFETESTLTLTDAKSKLAASHSAMPTNPTDALDQDEQAILMQVPNTTVFAALAHGDRNGLFDSNKADFIEFILGAESIGTAISSKILSLIPEFNIAAFWACAVLTPDPPYPGVGGFGLLGPHQDIVGFPAAVTALTYTHEQWDGPKNSLGWPINANGGLVPPTVGISLHAKEYWTKLAGGKTSGESVVAANKAVRCLGLTGLQAVQVNMINGNSSTARLKYVFLSSLERHELQHDPVKIDVWWVELTQFED